MVFALHVFLKSIAYCHLKTSKRWVFHPCALNQTGLHPQSDLCDGEGEVRGAHPSHWGSRHPRFPRPAALSHQPSEVQRPEDNAGAQHWQLWGQVPAQHIQVSQAGQLTHETYCVCLSDCLCPGWMSSLAKIVKDLLWCHACYSILTLCRLCALWRGYLQWVWSMYCTCSGKRSFSPVVDGLLIWSSRANWIKYPVWNSPQ